MHIFDHTSFDVRNQTLLEIKKTYALKKIEDMS
jgi:hypothetical protein